MFEFDKMVRKVKIFIDGKKTGEKKINKSKKETGKAKKKKQGQSFGGVEDEQVQKLDRKPGKRAGNGRGERNFGYFDKKRRPVKTIDNFNEHKKKTNALNQFAKRDSQGQTKNTKGGVVIKVNVGSEIDNKRNKGNIERGFGVVHGIKRTDENLGDSLTNN